MVEGDGAPLFPTTQWTELSVFRRASDVERREILQRVLQRYDRALRVFLLHKGAGAQVEDVLQGFVADKLLRNDLLGVADRGRGRFRSLIATALERYWYSYQRASKRDGRIQFHEEVDRASGPSPTATDVFDVEWARELITRAVNAVEANCRDTGRPDIWGVFNDRVSGPLLRGKAVLPYEELVDRYDLVSPTQASNLLISGKRMFMRLLREAIGEYERDEIEREIEDLRRILLRAAEAKEWSPNSGDADGGAVDDPGA